MLDAALALAAIIVVMMGLAVVERRRRSTPLVFCCRRCAAEFCQPPHRDYPRACPRCRARDWAT